MCIPEYVQTDSVHAQGFAQFDALVPIRFGDAWVVQFGSFYDEWLPVQQKGTFSGFEAGLLGKRVEVPLVAPGDGDFSVFERNGQPYVERVLQVFLVPAVEHGDVTVFLAHDLLYVGALGIERLVGIGAGAGITDYRPWSHDGVGNSQLCLVGIPSGTARRQHVVFSVVLEYGRCLAALPDEVAGKASAGAQVVVGKFTYI